MTADRDELAASVAVATVQDAVVPMSDDLVPVPAAAVEKLREAYISLDSQSVLNAARDLLDAADTPRDEGRGRLAGKSQGAASASEPPTLRSALTAPAAPPERCLDCLHPFDGHEGLTCAEMEAKHGVVPVSDEAPPPVSAEEATCPVCAEWETQYDAAMEHVERLRRILAGWQAAKEDA